jgi:hypothetical protein
MYLLIIQLFLYMYLLFPKKNSLHAYQKKKGWLSRELALAPLHDKIRNQHMGSVEIIAGGKAEAIAEHSEL